MSLPLSLVTPVSSDQSVPRSPAPAAAELPQPALARVIEIGEVAAGIAVPEDEGVRFFSASRDFDGLDGALFRSSEQAARAVRALKRPAQRRLPQRLSV